MIDNRNRIILIWLDNSISMDRVNNFISTFHSLNRFLIFPYRLILQHVRFIEARGTAFRMKSAGNGSRRMEILDEFMHVILSSVSIDLTRLNVEFFVPLLKFSTSMPFDMKCRGTRISFYFVFRGGNPFAIASNPISQPIVIKWWKVIWINRDIMLFWNVNMIYLIIIYKWYWFVIRCI